MENTVAVVVVEEPKRGAFFITLKDRPDRAGKFEQWAKKDNMPWTTELAHVSPYVATRHARGGDYGCWHSHIEVMRMAVTIGLDYAFIFEDDAMPTHAARCQKLWNSTFAQIRRLMKENPCWDVIGLGGIPLTWWHTAKKVDTDIIQVPFLEAHAYIASKAFMSKMIQVEYTGTFDSELVRRAAPESYIVRQELFEQDPECGSNLSLASVIPFRRTYKKIVWGWTRQSETPLRNIWLLLIACVAIVISHPLSRSLSCRRPVYKYGSYATLGTLVVVYMINEYGQDCHSARYRRSCKPCHKNTTAC